MTEQSFDTSDGESGEDKTVTIRRSQIKALEKSAKDREDLAAQLKVAQRKLMFAEAGLPLGDKRVNYFVRGYDGEETPEAIREAAVEIGLLEVNDQIPGQTTVDQQVEQSNIEAIQKAGRGAGVPQPGNLEAGLEAAMAEGGVAALSSYLAQQGIPLSED